MISVSRVATDVNSEDQLCADEVKTPIPFEGSVLLYVEEAGDYQLTLVDRTGRYIVIVRTPGEIIANYIFYYPVNSHVAFLDVQRGDSEDVNSLARHLRVWALNSPEVRLVNDLVITPSLRPLQWLGSGHFLLGDIRRNSFQILSTATSVLEQADDTYLLPNMRLLPLTYREDYDIAFSPDGRFVVYETDAIGQGLMIWDMTKTRQIGEVISDYSGLDVALPAWSYDSGKLAFASFVETEMQLHLFDEASSDVIQVSHFQTNLPEYGKPWSTIRTISWSPSGRYVAFNGTLNNSSLHILDVNTQKVVDTCIENVPVIWLPDEDFVVLSGNPIRILDVESNHVYLLGDYPGKPIAATVLPVSSFAKHSNYDRSMLRS